MAVTYKDIDLLTQKSAVVGTEKIPVSDTEYITVSQIWKNKLLDVEEDGFYIVDSNNYIGFYVDEQGVHSVPPVPTISTSIADDASSDTKAASPHSVKTYVDNAVGDIETLLAAL